MNEIIRYLSFSDWLFSLNIMLSRSIQLILDGNVSPFATTVVLPTLGPLAWGSHHLRDIRADQRSNILQVSCGLSLLLQQAAAGELRE